MDLSVGNFLKGTEGILRRQNWIIWEEHVEYIRIEHLGNEEMKRHSNSVYFGIDRIETRRSSYGMVTLGEYQAEDSQRKGWIIHQNQEEIEP